MKMREREREREPVGGEEKKKKTKVSDLLSLFYGKCQSKELNTNVQKISEAVKCQHKVLKENHNQIEREPSWKHVYLYYSRR